MPVIPKMNDRIDSLSLDNQEWGDSLASRKEYGDCTTGEVRQELKKLVTK